MNVCGGLISENVSYNAIYQLFTQKMRYSFLIVFEYSIKQKAPTIVRLLMLINDVFSVLNTRTSMLQFP